MANHATFTVATDVPIYFRAPRTLAARLQREHQWAAAPNPAQGDRSLPRQCGDLRHIQRSLNGRPRKTLGYVTPSEKLAEIVAATG